MRTPIVEVAGAGATASERSHRRHKRPGGLASLKPAGRGRLRRWRSRSVRDVTPGMRLAALVAVVGMVMAIVTPSTVATVVVGAGLLAVAAIAQRAERQRRQLHEALGQARSDHARADELVAAERADLTSQLEFWATHDPVTRLGNRTWFTRIVADVISAGEPCGVMTISLSEFGAINSTYGSAVGDQVLQAIAGRLQHALRGEDVAGRLGGDDFGVLLRGLQAPNAELAGARLLRVFADPVVIDDISVAVQARVGLAVQASNDSTDALELLRRAEVAAAASKPREGVHVFAPALQAAAAERNRLDGDLRRSLTAGEFVCFYQPLVSTVDGRVTAVEALVRWKHPQRGLVLPEGFIAAAERTGLIVPLGLTVLKQACRQLRAWTQMNGHDLTVAVNLSARQLAEPGFVETVSSVVWGCGVDPRQIVLEITESLLVEDGEAAIAVLWQLRGLGFRLAVDDFGTGYSSLSRLSDLPIDEMKIDRSFTSRIDTERRDSAAIITAAVAMGHALGLTVVAEGVETSTQAAFLRHINCDLLQGYLLARPLEADQVTPLLGQALLDVTNTPSRPAPSPPPNHPDRETPLVPRILPPVEGPVPKRLFAR
jgi:diguanylate cyclase (GGDEF)-like protein